MLSKESVKETISNLKGRISKCLSSPKSFSDIELVSLDGIYATIDTIILDSKKLTKTKATKFKKLLKGYGELIENSEKPYIQKHVLPVIKRVTNQEWV